MPWSSAKTAGDELSINSGNITKVCKGKYKTAGGYRWGYEKLNKLKNISLYGFRFKLHPKSS